MYFCAITSELTVIYHTCTQFVWSCMISIPVDHADEPVKIVFSRAMSVNPLEDLPQIAFHVVLGKLSPQSFQVSWQMVAWPLSHYPSVKLLVSRKTHPSLLIDLLNHVDLPINLALDPTTTLMSVIPTTGEKVLFRFRCSWNINGTSSDKVWEWVCLTGDLQYFVWLTDSRCLPICFIYPWFRFEILIPFDVCDGICRLPSWCNKHYNPTSHFADSFIFLNNLAVQKHL